MNARNEWQIRITSTITWSVAVFSLLQYYDYFNPLLFHSCVRECCELWYLCLHDGCTTAVYKHYTRLLHILISQCLLVIRRIILMGWMIMVAGLAWVCSRSQFCRIFQLQSLFDTNGRCHAVKENDVIPWKFINILWCCSLIACASLQVRCDVLVVNARATASCSFVFCFVIKFSRWRFSLFVDFETWYLGLVLIAYPLSIEI